MRYAPNIISAFYNWTRSFGELDSCEAGGHGVTRVLCYGGHVSLIFATARYTDGFGQSALGLPPKLQLAAKALDALGKIIYAKLNPGFRANNGKTHSQCADIFIAR